MSQEIIVKTQEELDALPASFEQYTRIVIKETPPGARLIVRQARGNSSVVARENSSVVARGNSSVVARENSSVVARENSSVEAWGCVAVHLQSDFASVVLFMFAVCFILAKGKVTKKSTTATIITPEFREGTDGWLDQQGIDEAETVILYKRVSKDFKTQEREKWETTWAIGSTLEHPKWKPTDQECGAGKFHACSRPHFCDEFRDGDRSDRYIAIEIAKADLYAWPNPEYPHKIAFRKGTVLYECDRLGKKTS